MKRLLTSYVFCLVGIIVFGIALVPMVSANDQFAHVIRSNVAEWKITIDFLPWVPAFMYSIIMLMVMIKIRKKEKVSAWLFPLTIPSTDEREKFLSADACRKAFSVIWVIAPVCAGLMCFYPLFADAFPIYPIVVVLLIPFVQVTVYFALTRKIYRP
jgi:hypothetical protein